MKIELTTEESEVVTRALRNYLLFLYRVKSDVPIMEGSAYLDKETDTLFQILERTEAPELEAVNDVG